MFNGCIRQSTYKRYDSFKQPAGSNFSDIKKKKSEKVGLKKASKTLFIRHL